MIADDLVGALDDAGNAIPSPGFPLSHNAITAPAVFVDETECVTTEGRDHRTALRDIGIGGHPAPIGLLQECRGSATSGEEDAEEPPA